MKKYLIILSLIILSSFIFFNKPVEAALLSIDDTVFGTNSILRDTATGLDWLDINAATTLGKKYSEVQTLLSSADYAGFRFAQQSELETLIDNSGYPGTDTHSAYDSLGTIIDSIGPTKTESSGEPGETMFFLRYLNGMLEADVIELDEYYVYVVPLGALINSRIIDASGDQFWSSNVSFNSITFEIPKVPGVPGGDDTNDPYRGAFLVRTTPGFVPIPEPSTFILLGGGLAGVAFMLRRAKM